MSAHETSRRPDRLRSVRAYHWQMQVVALGVVIAAAEVIAWTWHRPTALWRALVVVASAVGWRWPLTVVVVGAAATALVVFSLPGRRWLPRGAGRPGLVQLAILAALLFGVLTFAWVFATTPEAASGQRTGPSRSNLAVQSGALVAGLAGGAITLWLNDHRRRHNQQELAQERDRIEEERFARAVELLGHDRAAVRVGAMHALAGLATAAPARTQTVLDVLCAYLRQPFRHPDWDAAPATPPGSHPGLETDGGNRGGTSAAEKPDRAELDGEREVRRTAQRLIAGLLPATEEDSPNPEPGAAALYVDLTSAELDAITLSTRVCKLRAVGAHFHEFTDFRGAHFHGEAVLLGAQFHGAAWFTEAHFHGVARFADSQFHGDARFARAQFHAAARFAKAQFHARFIQGEPREEASFAEAQFHGDASFAEAQFHWGRVWFVKAQFHGDPYFIQAQFRGDARFDEAQFHGDARIYLARASFRGDLVLPRDVQVVSAVGATVDGQRQIELPRGWKVESPGQTVSGLLPPGN